MIKIERLDPRYILKESEVALLVETGAAFPKHDPEISKRLSKAISSRKFKLKRQDHKTLGKMKSAIVNALSRESEEQRAFGSLAFQSGIISDKEFFSEDSKKVMQKCSQATLSKIALMSLLSSERLLSDSFVSGYAKLFENAKKKFMLRIEPMIKNGMVPIDLDTVRERISKVSFEIQDSLRYGCCDVYCEFDQQRVVVPTCQLVTLHENDFFHELFHAISGRSVIRITGDSNSIIEVQRSGLSFKRMNFSRELEDPYIFDWLNEAVTEYLAESLSVVEDLGESYVEECKALKLLTKKFEIPFSYFSAAYFADYRVGDKKGGRYPEFGKLLDAVEKKAGKGFLQNLEKIHRIYDIEAVIEMLEADDPASEIENYLALDSFTK